MRHNSIENMRKMGPTLAVLLFIPLAGLFICPNFYQETPYEAEQLRNPPKETPMEVYPLDAYLDLKFGEIDYGVSPAAGSRDTVQSFETDPKDFCNLNLSFSKDGRLKPCNKGEVPNEVTDTLKNSVTGQRAVVKWNKAGKETVVEGIDKSKKKTPASPPAPPQPNANYRVEIHGL